MAAQGAGPTRHDLFDQARATLADREGQGGAEGLLCGDPFGDARSAPVRLERHAEQNLVQVNMGVDQRARHQTAVKGDFRGTRRRGNCTRRANLRDQSGFDQDIDRPPLGTVPVAQEEGATGFRHIAHPI